MCLIKTHCFPKKAKENITCYKYLKCRHSIDTLEYITPFMHEDVIPGETILTSAKNIFFGIFFKSIRSEGVHSYKEKQPIFYSTGFVAIIPKGAWYYEGEDGDLASSKLIITDKIV